jgi:hypothetical protein
MKNIFISLLCTFSLGLMAASHDEFLTKIESKIAELESSAEKQNEQKISVPWNQLYEHEISFWNLVLKGDVLIKTNASVLRPLYLQQAMTAQTLPLPERIQHLENWVSQMNKKIYTLGLSYEFYRQWKGVYSGLKTALSRMEGVNNSLITVKSDARGIKLDQKNFLESLLNDFKNLKTPTQIITQYVPNPATSTGTENTSFHFIHYLAIGAAALLALTLGVLLKKADSTEKKIDLNIQELSPKMEVSEAINLPPLPIENDALKTIHEEVIPLNNQFGVHLEDVCQEVLHHHEHLLKLSQVQYSPSKRSAFTSFVCADPKRVNEALQWMLKGTLAIANSAKKNSPKLDCQFMEREGRVVVDFTLNGIDYDMRTLQLHTIMDGDSSAPYNFSRTELCLPENSPIVSLRHSPEQTTISLSLDSLYRETTH